MCQGLLDLKPTSWYSSLVEPNSDSKSKILNAALRLIRERGYEATTVDALCELAKVSKGSFFHYFKSKEELAIAAADHFAKSAEALFSTAPFISLADPRDRVLAYIDFRRGILQGDLPDYTCLLGTMVQETYSTHPSIRNACDHHLSEHAHERSRDILEAKQRYAPHAVWDALSLSFFIQASLQGAFILAKAQAGSQIADDCLLHLRRYVELLFPLHVRTKE